MKKNLIKLVLLLSIATLCFATTPRTLGYSSRLTDADGMAIDELGKTISFRIYDVITDGIALWGETLSVDIVDGFLDVDFGGVHGLSLAFDANYWLELQIDSDGDDAITFSDEILTPRERFMPVAFSQRSTYADTADYYEESQTLSEVLTEGNDAEGTIITGLPVPTIASDAVNKAYVDALESGEGIAQTYCVYVDYSQTCPAGWMELGSNIGAVFGSRSTKVCCQSATSDLDGYLVLSGATHNGNFQGYGGATSGLQGANLWCLDQVRSYNWNGKGDTDSLTTTNVKAFLCDSDSCNNLESNSAYQFASCYSTGDGGAAFITDGYGRGPRNGDYWHSDSYFDETREYWMNRGNTVSYPTSRWGNEPYSSTYSCTNWSATSGSGYTGYSVSNNSGRWAYTAQSCGSTYYLICIVNM